MVTVTLFKRNLWGKLISHSFTVENTSEGIKACNRYQHNTKVWRASLYNAAGKEVYAVWPE